MLRPTPCHAPHNMRYNTRVCTQPFVADLVFSLIERYQPNRTPLYTFQRLPGCTLHLSARHTYCGNFHTDARYARQPLSPNTLRRSNEGTQTSKRYHVAFSTRRCQVLHTGMLADAREASHAAQGTHMHMHRHIPAQNAGVMRQSVSLSTGSTDASHIDPCTHRPTEHIRVRVHGSFV